jgi:hypothetical protein
MQHDLDPRLQALFAQSAPDLRDEAFVIATIRRVDAARSRQKIVAALLRGAGILAIGVASPVLIGASAWLSARLDSLFAVTDAGLSTPLGTLLAVVGSITLVLWYRKRITG